MPTNLGSNSNFTKTKTISTFNIVETLRSRQATITRNYVFYHFDIGLSCNVNKKNRK